MDDSWNTSGIYMLTCKINGKRYIGQSKNIKRRLKDHSYSNNRCPLISRAITKYGRENFEATVLEFCPIDKLDEREIYYIAELKPEYNITEGGKRPKLSLETREKMKTAAVKNKAIHQKKIVCLDTGIEFNSIKEAAAAVGIKNANGIGAVAHGRAKTAGGYRWKFADAENPPEYIRTDFQKKFIICYETKEIFNSVNGAAEKFGISANSISSVLHGHKRTAAGCHWKFLRDYNEQEKIIYDDKPIKKPVVCISTGEKFSSISEAARAVGCSVNNISQVVNGRCQTACGLRWKFADAENPPEEFYKDPRKKPVLCVETGIIFQSIVEASKSIGLKRGDNISAVIHGRQKKAGGCHWKLIEEETDKND